MRLIPSPVPTRRTEPSSNMSPRNPISPVTARGLAASRLWCASVKTEVLGRGYSVLPTALRLADSQKHEAPISIFTSANQEMGT
jgi:hypothetical protein